MFTLLLPTGPLIGTENFRNTSVILATVTQTTDVDRCLLDAGDVLGPVPPWYKRSLRFCNSQIGNAANV